MTLYARFRTWCRALLYVATNGDSARRRASRRAAAPPRKCHECSTLVPHSTDWRDHLDASH